jgi:hypothetical protein
MIDAMAKSVVSRTMGERAPLTILFTGMRSLSKI